MNPGPDVVEYELSDDKQGASEAANKNMTTGTTGVPIEIYELPVMGIDQ